MGGCCIKEIGNYDCLCIKVQLILRKIHACRSQVDLTYLCFCGQSNDLQILLKSCFAV